MAESSPLGHKLVEAFRSKKVGFRFIKNQDKALELKKLEQEMLKEDVTERSRTKKNGSDRKGHTGRKSRSRSRSRTRSRSPANSRRPF